MNIANDPVYPIIGYDQNTLTFDVKENGMTMRQYYAGQVMIGLCNAAGENEPEGWNYAMIATCAVKAADALIAELSKPLKP